MTKQSLLEHAGQEAAEYKWLASEKAGRDLGDEAVREWERLYWLSFCRHRWVEHLQGDVYWEEFDEDHFRLLKRVPFRASPELVDLVVHKFRRVGENLDIIVWAIDEGQDVQAVIEVLEHLDINTQREAWMSL